MMASIRMFFRLDDQKPNDKTAKEWKSQKTNSKEKKWNKRNKRNQKFDKKRQKQNHKQQNFFVVVN